MPKTMTCGFRIAYRFPQVGYVPRSLAVYHLDTPDSFHQNQR